MSARPRVILVITRLIVGGAQLTVRGLCDDLSERFDMHVVCGPDTGSEGSLLEEVRKVAPVTVLPDLRRDIHPLQDLTVVRSLKATYERLRPDIVHTHSSKAGILGRLAARGFRPVVHTVHGWGHTPLDPAWRRHTFIALERLVASRTDALVAVSEDVRDEGLRLRIGTPEQYRLIPAYVDYRPSAQDFTAARRRARDRLGLSEDEVVIGWIGRFVLQKDPDTLARALRRTLDRHNRGTRAVLVGDGPLRERVRRELAPLGDRVLFTGRLANVRELYAAFDVLVHLSRWEGQPMVVQEAIAERVPVVATRASGVEDLVRDGVGYVVEPGDAGALMERTLAVLASGELRAPLPPEVVAPVAERHDRVVTIAKHIRLYEELLEAASGRPCRTLPPSVGADRPHGCGAKADRALTA
jgi:glycosyltransferase involved in cell wall biosynthesis